MPDPFEQLQAPVVPVDPDPAFAARLRARLARAFEGGPDAPAARPSRNRPGSRPRPAAGTRSEGADMPDQTTLDEVDLGDRQSDAPTNRTAVPAAAVITPHLAVAGARAALGFYAEAFGARLTGAPIVMAGGRIGHAELDLGGARLMLSEEHPEIGVTAPVPGQGASVTLHLEVADVDAVVDRALGAGATLERAAADYDYGRNAVLHDPFGHRWLVSGPVRDAGPVARSMAAAPRRPPVAGAGGAASASGGVAGGDDEASTPGLRHGDIGYVSLWVPDAERAADFFAAVIGWRYRPGAAGHSRQVDGQSLHHGLWSVAGPPTLFCCYAVASMGEALDRVRSAGGTAEAPQHQPYGLVAGCTDDQGVRFAVFEPPDGAVAAAGGPRPPADGARQGDLAYVTMEVVDSGRARAFHGAVLGWRFTPGHVRDGWQVPDVEPMVGLSGGHAAATIVPMYRVDDIDTAVAAVRRAGGTAMDPERKPYGVTSTCTDDQGTRFYLGQL